MDVRKLVKVERERLGVDRVDLLEAGKVAGRQVVAYRYEDAAVGVVRDCVAVVDSQDRVTTVVVQEEPV